MTLVTTVPERLALMAWDSDTDFKARDHLYRTTYDDLLRPAIYVEDEGGDFPPVGAGAEQPQEIYTITIIGPRYGQGEQFSNTSEALQAVRSWQASVVNYLLRRTQLQFSNNRNDSGLTALPALTGVMWARIRREPCGIVHPSEEGEGPFWGGIVRVTVTEIIQATEVLTAVPVM